MKRNFKESQNRISEFVGSEHFYVGRGWIKGALNQLRQFNRRQWCIILNICYKSYPGENRNQNNKLTLTDTISMSLLNNKQIIKRDK